MNQSHLLRRWKYLILYFIDLVLIDSLRTLVGVSLAHQSLVLAGMLVAMRPNEDVFLVNEFVADLLLVLDLVFHTDKVLQI